MLSLILRKNQALRKLFDGDLKVTRICSDLEVLLQQKITPGKTLLFFDEIQACSRAITALRYFYEEMPELHVVAAGSLLEFAFEESSSSSAGGNWCANHLTIGV